MDTLFLPRVRKSRAVLWEQRVPSDIIPSAASALVFLCYSFNHSAIPCASSGMAVRSPSRLSLGLKKGVFS